MCQADVFSTIRDRGDCITCANLVLATGRDLDRIVRGIRGLDTHEVPVGVVGEVGRSARDRLPRIPHDRGLTAQRLY